MRLISGHIKQYDVFVTDEGIIVTNDAEIVTKQPVPGLSDFLAHVRALRLGWAAFADFEVIYLYDRHDDNFGYAVNLQNPQFSEWGYAPFR